jgi:hypothetical protein
MLFDLPSSMQNLFSMICQQLTFLQKKLILIFPQSALVESVFLKVNGDCMTEKCQAQVNKKASERRTD